MKKFTVAVAVLFTLTLLLGGCSANKETEGLFYSLDDGAYVVTGYGGESKSVVIPNTKDGVIVDKVDYEAFQEKTITKVVLGENITWIDLYAFDGCTNLKDVILSDNLDTIRGWAFKNCTAIKKIEVPESCWFIGYHAFEGWGEDQTIVINGSTSSFENGWNENCDAKIIIQGD